MVEDKLAQSIAKNGPASIGKVIADAEAIATFIKMGVKPDNNQ